MSERDQERLHVFFSGWVQGVGFRFTTIHVARDYEVVGFVKNLSDGRVELVAEGVREELEGFLAAMRRRLDRHIEKADVSWHPATGEFSDFDIRY